MRLPLLFLVLVSYVAGLLTCAWAPWPWSIACLGAVFAASLVARSRIARTPGYLLPFIVLPLVTGYGLMYGQLHTLPANHISRYLSGARWDVSGTLAKPPERWPDRTRLIVQAAEIARGNERCGVLGTIRATFYGELPLLRTGDYIRLKDVLSPVRIPPYFAEKATSSFTSYVPPHCLR